MKTFYFTFGTDPEHPYRGGWVEVIAEDMEKAVTIFNRIFPSRREGIVNCAFVYTEEEFKKSIMEEVGNFGNKCHAVYNQKI